MLDTGDETRARDKQAIELLRQSTVLTLEVKKEPLAKIKCASPESNWGPYFGKVGF